MIYHEETNKYGERRVVRGPLPFWDRPIGLWALFFLWGLIALVVILLRRGVT